MIRFGTHASAAGGVDKALQRAHDVGARSVQVFTKNERQWVGKPLDSAVIARFHEAREMLGFPPMALSSHASYLINIASSNPDLFEKSMTALADECARCNQLGIPLLVLHPGAHTGAGTEVGIANVAAAINRVHAANPSDPTITCLENTAGQGTSLGAHLEELAAIIDRVEDKARIGVCFDTCHAFAAGYDLRTETAVRQTMNAFDAVIGLGSLKVLHLNDSVGALGSHRDRHAHIGEGGIGVEGFHAFINERRLDGLPGMLETEKDASGDHDRANLALLTSLVAGASPISERG